MTACNAQPPAGHPFHGSLVACHLDCDHLRVGIPHSWDTVPWARGVLLLLGMFPNRRVVAVDWQLPHRLEVWETNENGERTGQRPYRVWGTEMEGPWVLVRFVDGEEWAVWKATGSVYPVGSDGAVAEDAINEESHRERLARLIAEIEAERPTFTCPRCGCTSAHPKDVQEGYCGACHDWTGELVGLTDQRCAEILERVEDWLEEQEPDYDPNTRWGGGSWRVGRSGLHVSRIQNMAERALPAFVIAAARRHYGREESNRGERQ